jgi:GNAT superfamily N-acetyltransferase
MTVSGKVTLRNARQEDVPRLVDLCDQLGYANEASAISQRLDSISSNPDHIFLVAGTPAGGVVGWAHGALRRLIVVPTHIELGGLVVDESHRSQGVGELLLSAIESWGRSQGIDQIYIRSNVTRTAAHRFYKQKGYREVKKSITFIKEQTG